MKGLLAASSSRSYDLGCKLVKQADKPKATYSLSGRLYKSDSDWILLSVPNSLVRGAFDALDEPGIELPPSPPGSKFNAHISVMRPEELDTISGGASAISERATCSRTSWAR